MARNAIEIVVLARDEATKQVGVIFDEFGRAARQLQAVTTPAAQAFDTLEQATTRQNASLIKAAQAVRGLALPITSELAPALGETSSVIIGVVARMSTMTAGLGLLGVAAAGVAAVIGGQLVKAFQDAAKEREEFEKALGSFDPGQQAARIKELSDLIRTLATERERLAEAAEGQDATLGLGGELPAIQTVDPRAREANLKRIADITEQINRLQERREILTRDTSAAEADADAQGSAFLERRRQNLAALNDLTRTRLTLQAAVESAEQAAAAREIGRQAERAQAAKRAQDEIIAGQQALTQARAEIDGQGAGDAARRAFAERIQLAQEETGIRVRAIQEQTEATIRGAQAELRAVQENARTLREDPLFGADNPAGAGLRGQAATLERQARDLQQRITDATRQAVSERAKAEEEGLTRIRSLRLQDAQAALQDLQRALAKEKELREQARADAQGLLGRAAASLQERGFGTATGGQLQAEAQRLAAGDTALLEALRSGTGAVDLSRLPAALGSRETLERFGGRLPNLSQAAAGGPESDFERGVQDELFRLSGGRFGRSSAVPAAEARARQAADAFTQGTAAGSRGLNDQIIEGIDEDGLTRRFVVIGERIGKAFSASLAQAVDTPEIADKIGAALADALTLLSAANP